MDHCIKAGIDCARLAPNEDGQAFFVDLLTAPCPIGLRGTYWQRNFAVGSADRGAAAPPPWCRQSTSVRCWASAPYSVLGGGGCALRLARPCEARRGEARRGAEPRVPPRCRGTSPGSPQPSPHRRGHGCALRGAPLPGSAVPSLGSLAQFSNAGSSDGVLQTVGAEGSTGRGAAPPGGAAGPPASAGSPAPAARCSGADSSLDGAVQLLVTPSGRAEPSRRTSLLPRKAAELLGIQLHDTPTPQLSPECRHNSQQQLSQLLLPRKFSQTRPPSTLEGMEKDLA